MHTTDTKNLIKFQVDDEKVVIFVVFLLFTINKIHMLRCLMSAITRHFIEAECVDACVAECTPV